MGLRSMSKAFADFAVKGNMIDLAIGIVMGVAFGAVIKSLVDDIIMPPIGLALGGVDFSELKIVIEDNEDPDEVVAISYGKFINNIITFLVIALVMFFVVQSIAAIKKRMEKEKEEEAAAEEVNKQEQLLEDIRYILSASTGVIVAKPDKLNDTDSSEDGIEEA